MATERKRIDQLKKKLAGLGPMLPGSLSKQWNVCSSPGCSCRKYKSKRHGPYYQLSFTVRGRSSTLFVKKDDVPEVRRRIRRYKAFKKLCAELTQASIDLARNEGFQTERNDHE